MEANEQCGREDYLTEVASIKKRLEQLACMECADRIECASCRMAVSALSVITVKKNPPKGWEGHVEMEKECE